MYTQKAFNIPAEYGRGIEIIAAKDLVAGDILKFPLDNELDKREIVCIDVWSSTELAFTPSQNEVVSLNALTSTTVSFLDGSDEKFKDLPSRNWRVSDNRGIRVYVDNFIFNMQSSFIQINESGLVDAGQAYYFTFWYKKGNRFQARRPR